MTDSFRKPGSARDRVNRAKRELRTNLLDEEGFTGIGVDETETGNHAIIVFVEKEDSPVTAHVPSAWRGFQVSVEIIGKPTRKRDPAK